MKKLRFELSRSKRLCFRGHVDTWEIRGTDDEGVRWLGNWTLYCQTCQALVCDEREFDQLFYRVDMDRSVVGYTVGVIMEMDILVDAGKEAEGEGQDD